MLEDFEERSHGVVSVYSNLCRSQGIGVSILRCYQETELPNRQIVLEIGRWGRTDA
jgi:hypothetical protein